MHSLNRTPCGGTARQLAAMGGPAHHGIAASEHTERPIQRSGPGAWLRRAVAAATAAILVALGAPTDAQAQGGAGALGNFFWNDINTNGLQDVGEPGMTNILVRLYETDSLSVTNFLTATLTDTNGFYSFTGLPATTPSNRYQIGFLEPTGFFFTTPNVGTNIFIDSDAQSFGLTPPITLAANETNFTWDAGVVRIQAGMSLTKLAADAPQGGIYYATQGEAVAYTFIITNTGNTYLSAITLVDTVDGNPIFFASIDCPDLLAPGETRAFTNVVVITQSVTNIAELCAVPADFKCRTYPGVTLDCVLDPAIVLVCPDPTLIPPSNVVVECSASDFSTNALGSPTLTNTFCECTVTNLSFSDTILFSEVCPQTYTIERLFTLQDSCEHTVTATQFIFVVDSTPPVLAGVPSNATVSCTNVPPPANVTATDNCATSPIPVSLSVSNVPGRCEGTYDIIRIWSATDSCFNAVSATQLVSVIDTLPPVLLGVPTNVTVECDDIPQAATNVIAVDSCTTSAIPVAFSESFLEGPCANSFGLARVWSATDTCGNAVSATQVVTVVDTTPPVILSIPSNSTIDCASSVPPSDPLGVVATDNCSSVQGLVTTVTTNENGGTGLPGSTHVIQYIYTVTDECDNSSSATQTITQICTPAYSLEKTLVSPTGRPAIIGETVVFSITVSNTGDVMLGSLRLEDTFDPARLAFVSAQPPVNASSSSLIVWSNVGPLAVGGSVTVTAQFTAVGATLPGSTTNLVVSQAFATNGTSASAFPEFGQPVGTQTARAPEQISAPSYLLIKSLVTPTNGLSTTGTVFQFSITITNTGDYAIQPYEVQDVFDPAVLLFVTSSPDVSASSPGLLVWSNLPPIDVGGSASISVSFIGLTNTYPAPMSNTAIATAGTTNGLPLPPQTSTVPIRTTYMLLAGVYGANVDGKAVVVWETDGEDGTAGFQLSRRDAAGNWVSVGPYVPAAGGGALGMRYGSADRDAAPGSTAVYRLTEVESRGGALSYGPFTVTFPKNPTAGLALASDGSLVRTAIASGPQGGSAARATLAAAPPAAAGSNLGAIKVAISSEGLYQLGVSQLATAFGRTTTDIKSLLASGGLGAYNLGRSVPVICTTNGISFFAKAGQTIYSDQNVYWITVSTARTMAPAPVAPASSSPGQAFWSDQKVERNLVVKPDLFDDPASDIWLWQSLSVSSATGNSLTVSFDAPGLVAGNPASITLNLKGGQGSAFHEARATLNGVSLGSTAFAGLETVSDKFALGNLAAANNTLTITAAGDSRSTFYVDSFTVHYRRALTASSDSLLFDADGSAPVTVGGFSRSDIEVFDVTDASNPARLTGPAVASDGGGYSVSFVPAGSRGRYLATLSSVRRSTTSVASETASQLAARENQADYLIISAGALKSTAQSLADYRKGRGLSTMVVDIQDVYDEFNHGNKDPQAISRLLSYARSSWTKAPKYLVLVGEGSLDYRNNLGFNDCTVPPATVRSGFGLQASDAPLGDADGNGSLDVAVGRLPAATPGDLQNAIAKIKAFESAGGNTRKKAVALADNADHGGDFAKDSDQFVASHLPGLSVARIYLGTASAPDAASARSQLISALNGGCGFVSYLGHSTQNRFAGEQLLTRDDVSHLNNKTRPPVVAAMTCLSGDIGIPGSVTLGETLVISSNGAAAVVAAGSQVYNAQSRSLAQLFASDIFEKGAARIGDAFLRAINASAIAGNLGASRSYMLLGDPALELKTLNTSGNTLAAGSSLVNDFDGDGISDIAAYWPAGGAWDVLRSSGQPLATVQLGWSGCVPVAADYDGDGVTDYAIYYPVGGSWYIRQSSDGKLVTRNWGWYEALAVPADYDGDGKADLATYHPPSGVWYLSLSSNSSVRTVQWGWSQAMPALGDYDGDGRADIATYVPSSGQWSILQSKDARARIVNWGWSQAMPVPCDYDGDKKTDVATYVPAQGTWYILLSTTGGSLLQNWGWSLAAPVPGDYDGDGKADLVTYVQSTGTWYIRQSSNGAGRVVTYGWSQAVPVTPQFQLNRKFFPAP